MLVLAREAKRKMQSLFIFDKGSVTEVKVVKLSKGQVRLGIECPPEARIFRGEIIPQLDGSDWSPEDREALEQLKQTLPTLKRPTES